ncbi:MAG: DUF1631 family protein [Burkholderiaceae bacterium]
MKRPDKRRLGVSGDSTGQRPTLKVCLEFVLEQTDSLVDKALDGLPAAIERSHDMLATEEHQAAVQAGIAALLAQRESLRERFQAQLQVQVMGGGTQDDMARPLVKFEDIQLLEEAQLDESIEVARAQEEVAMAVDDVLPQLDAMMSTLMGWVTVQSSLNPLRPDTFVRCLRETLASVVRHPEVRGELIVPAAGLMGVELRKLYRETVDWLRSCGVEPAGVTQPVIATDASGAAVPGSSSVSRTLVTLDRLRKLLSGELDGPARKPQDFLYTVPASVETLQDMQQVEAMVQRLSVRAKQAAGAAAAGGAAKPAKRPPMNSRQLGEAVGEEVARMMLERLIADDRLLPPVRDLLMSLELQLLKLAETDVRFFSDRLHPARQFLDRVINRSLGFAAVQDEGFAKYLRSVQQSVKALNDHADQGVAAFAAVLQKLTDHWAKEDKAQRLLNEETARALMHAEQRNLLAQRLTVEFRKRCEDKDVPPLLVDFLTGAWAQVVAQAQLSGADNTADTEGYQALVKELIWSVQPDRARANPVRLVELIPSLLARLRAGLALISYPPERIKVLFDHLIAMHEAAIDGVRANSQANAMAQAFGNAPPAMASSLLNQGNTDLSSPHEGEVDSEFWLAAHEAAESGYLNEEAVMPLDVSGGAPTPEDGVPKSRTLEIDDLTKDTWIELLLEGAWLRAQLTWVSPHRSLFMFTSRSGSAHSMSRRTMERLMKQGVIRMVSDGHVVEKALDSVAQMALRNTLDNPPADGAGRYTEASLKR